MCSRAMLPLLSYVVYFLQQAGLPTTDAFKFGLGQYSLAIVGVVVAWFLTPRFGRRTLILSRITFVTLTTFLIGFLGPSPAPILRFFSSPVALSSIPSSPKSRQVTCDPRASPSQELPTTSTSSSTASLCPVRLRRRGGIGVPRLVSSTVGGIKCIGIIWGYFGVTSACLRRRTGPSLRSIFCS
ncbi:hypothetical protein GMDG_05857 [Pseudogymnoascus destructans 20631-21]|uniref:Major facilitator superfamily (MFS) profile domain-containing protein n=1 Tax=Pseudogymnoascus destructans (strain ATCC MYA-4855 / 20631-21) TaxID=658429 RepID=L8FQ09_PSED2|nr:hypothetical protein GMDG_05857 [Pseudogymnoascus destructans 20631-21]